MRFTALFLSLTTPLLSWVAVHLWIQLNIGDWAEESSSLSLMTRSLLAVDIFVVRYALIVGVVSFLLAPLLAAALARVATLPETPDSWPHERVKSTVSSLGRWLIVTFVLTGIAVPLELLSPVRAFAFSVFLGWSAFVGLVLALAHMYTLQEYRRRAGRSRWPTWWLVGLTTVLNCFFYPIASYLLPTAFYFYGRYEVAQSGPSPETATAK